MSPNAKVSIITRPYKRASGFFGGFYNQGFPPLNWWFTISPKKITNMYVYIYIYSCYSWFNAVVWVLWVGGGGAKVSSNIYAGFTWKKSLIIYHLCRPSWNPQGKDLRTCGMYHPGIQMRLIMFDPRDIMASSVACFSASSLSFACLRRCWNYILYWVVGGPKSTRRHCVLC